MSSVGSVKFGVWRGEGMTASKRGVTAAELFEDTPYDGTTLATMIEAFAAACQDAGLVAGKSDELHANELRLQIVVRILKAAAAGERDPDRMKRLALRAIDAQPFHYFIADRGGDSHASVQLETRIAKNVWERTTLMSVYQSPGAKSLPQFNEELRRRIAYIGDSYRRLTGRTLVPDGDPVERLWSAPFAIVAHGIEPDPVFFFGNYAALVIFEMDFDAFARLPSRLSAEPMLRSERARLLGRVTRDGIIEDYSGVRISATGRRFRISSASVWNLTDTTGSAAGQAAAFLPANVQL